MNTADLIISIVFICINSTALFLIYRAISRWMTRNEKKIDDLEHCILKIDDYIRYSSHVIESVYIDVQNRLIEQFVKDQDYERADMVKRSRQITEAAVLKEMKERMKQTENELLKFFVEEQMNKKKGGTKED